MNQNGSDPFADFGELWAAVHDWLIVEGDGEGGSKADIAKAYTRLVAAHNMIHDRYIASEEQAPRIAGG